jgi:hypothetical protein
MASYLKIKYAMVYDFVIARSLSVKLLVGVTSTRASIRIIIAPAGDNAKRS